MDDTFDESLEFSDSDSEEMPLKDATYEALNIEEITHKMNQKIEEVVSTTGMPATVARIALGYCDWNKMVLLEKYTDDQQKFFDNANIKNPFLEVEEDEKRRKTDCLTCFEQLPSDMIVSLSCKHNFCSDCWSQYLTMKINEGAESIACQQLKCGITVDDDTITQILTDEKIKDRYKRLCVNSFVRNDPFLEWCPAPDCQYAIEASFTPIYRLNCTCKCGHGFCFECRNSHHEPIPCDLYKIWLQYMTDPTYQYMSKNTKACPKCGCLIEKNMGCSYMFCTRCRTEFCWTCFKKCFANWKLGHGMCNTPKDQRPKQPQTNTMVRFQNYNKLYLEQKKSLDAERDFAAKKIDLTIKNLIQEGILLSEIQILHKGLDILLSCRQNLMLSYVFAYFVKECNQTAIFEENQRDLGGAADILSGYLQMDFTPQNVLDMKIKIWDKFEYCDQRQKKLLSHIQEGLEKGWWTFSENG
ncbi:potential E3 ubiquitin-protein ligase ariadne-1-like [Contarinia nasturtii]|uniref:potential E3 ubiquitin-protein ligase ariadne-1-like n=1 Tax=Contarinia nasturtii TaxID=265458 RepID=UPI0012D4B123|nr:potential E3 ubiquitin-protein ligase ariadne-1-like [Contarinia nasturtii]